MGNLIHDFQLKDHRTGAAIRTAGGKCTVLTAGTPDKATLYDPITGLALANPITPTNGRVNFAVVDTVTSVDLAVMAPGGQFLFMSGAAAQEQNEIAIDQGQRYQLMKVPFSHADQAGDNTITDTGFDLPSNSLLLPQGVGILVVDTDATETINVGLGFGTESGFDVDGLIVGASVATAGLVPAQATMTAGGTETYFSACTLGALLADFLAGANVATDVGSYNPKALIADGTLESIDYTLSAGADTASGFILLPYLLMGS